METDVDKKEIQIPFGILEPETEYVLRVGFFKYLPDEIITAWSAPFLFTTQQEEILDADGDGVPDAIRITDPTQLSDTIDDCTAETLFSDAWKCIDTIEKKSQMCLKCDSGMIEWLNTVPPAELDAETGLYGDREVQDDDFPLGILHFRIIPESPENPVVVAVCLSRRIPENAVFINYDAEMGWVKSGIHHLNERRIGFEMELTDGGAGDADNTQNGIIVYVGGIDTSTARSNIRLLSDNPPQMDESFCFIQSVSM